MTTMGLKAIGTAIAEQAKKAGREDAELTRLLAVEVAAKILAGPSNVRYSPESQDMAAYQCLTCHSSWDKKSDPVHASSCPVLVINPIGDKK